MLLLALALCTKALMPAGYMLGSSSRQLTVEICSDGFNSHVTKQIAIPMDGKSQSDQKHGKTDSACAFSHSFWRSVLLPKPLRLGGASPISVRHCVDHRLLPDNLA